MKVRMKTSIAGNEFSFRCGAVVTAGDGYTDATAPADVLAAWVEGGVIAEALGESPAPVPVPVPEPEPEPEPEPKKRGKGK